MIALLNVPLVYRSIAALMKNYAVIFMLHRFEDQERGVSGHSLAFLDQALTFLRNEGYQFVALEDLVRRVQQGLPPLKNSICFTIDDGYFEQAALAAPVFEKHNCPVSIFLITGFVDGKLWPWYDQAKYIFSKTKKRKLELSLYDKPLEYDLSERSWLECVRSFRELCKTLPEDELFRAIDELSCVADVGIPEQPATIAQPMTWGMAREFEERNARFGPHSETHMIMSNIDRDRVRDEMSQSWARVKTELVQPLDIFCFPNGRSEQDFNDVDVAMARALGFSAVLSTDPGYVHRRQMDRYCFDRISFPDGMDELVRVVSKTRGAQYWYDKKVIAPMTRVYGGKRGFLNYYKSMLNYSVGRYRSLRSVDWSKVERLVFICLGNVCRSPYAEAIAKRHGFNSISFGVDTSDGKPANHRAIAIARERDVDLTAHATKRVEHYAPTEGDLIVGMEMLHLERFDEKFAGTAVVQKTLLGLSLDEGVKPYIHDPYCGSDAYFRQCFNVIEQCLTAIFARVSNCKP